MDDMKAYIKQSFMGLSRQVMEKNYQQQTLGCRLQKFKETRRETRNENMLQRRNIDLVNMSPFESVQKKKSFVKAPIAQSKVSERLEKLRKWKEEKEKRRLEEKRSAKPVFKVCHVSDKIGTFDYEAKKGKFVNSIIGRSKASLIPKRQEFKAPVVVKPLYFDNTKTTRSDKVQKTLTAGNPSSSTTIRSDNKSKTVKNQSGNVGNKSKTTKNLPVFSPPVRRVTRLMASKLCESGKKTLDDAEADPGRVRTGKKVKNFSAAATIDEGSVEADLASVGTGKKVKRFLPAATVDGASIEAESASGTTGKKVKLFSSAARIDGASVEANFGSVKAEKRKTPKSKHFSAAPTIDEASIEAELESGTTGMKVKRFSSAAVMIDEASVEADFGSVKAERKKTPKSKQFPSSSTNDEASIEADFRTLIVGKKETPKSKLFSAASTVDEASVEADFKTVRAERKKTPKSKHFSSPTNDDATIEADFGTLRAERKKTPKSKHFSAVATSDEASFEADFGTFRAERKKTPKSKHFSSSVTDEASIEVDLASVVTGKKMKRFSAAATINEASVEADFAKAKADRKKTPKSKHLAAVATSDEASIEADLGTSRAGRKKTPKSKNFSSSIAIDDASVEADFGSVRTGKKVKHFSPAATIGEASVEADLVSARAEKRKTPKSKHFSSFATDEASIAADFKTLRAGRKETPKSKRFSSAATIDEASVEADFGSVKAEKKKTPKSKRFSAAATLDDENLMKTPKKTTPKPQTPTAPSETQTEKTPKTRKSKPSSPPLTPKNPPTRFSGYISPFVTISRGKDSIRKEYKQRMSTGGTIPGNRLTSPGAGAAYFTNLLANEIERIEQMCEEWSLYKTGQIPDEAKEMIDVTIGQSKLLMSKKFVQFQQLIQHCLNNTGTQRVTCMDLHGYWDMMYMQVEDIDKRFNNLSALRNKNWEEVLPERVIKAKKPKARKTKLQASSKIREMIMQAKAKKNQPKTVFPSPSLISSPGLAVMRLSQSIKNNDGLTPNKGILKTDDMKEKKSGKNVIFSLSAVKNKLDFNTEDDKENMVQRKSNGTDLTPLRRSKRISKCSTITTTLID